MTTKKRVNKNLFFLKFSGACGILGSVLPLIIVLLATFLSSWFRWDTNALSDLGVGDQALLFNSAVMLSGLLNFFFALGLFRYLGKETLNKVGVMSIIASSVSLALVGIFTINYFILHVIAALGYFLLAPIGFLLIGSGTKVDVIRKVSMSCGITALVAILALPAIFFMGSFKIGFAVPELIETLTISTWTIFMSVKLLGRSS